MHFCLISDTINWFQGTCKDGKSDGALTVTPLVVCAVGGGKLNLVFQFQMCCTLAVTPKIICYLFYELMSDVFC